jgi:hypothetical protein
MLKSDQSAWSWIQNQAKQWLVQISHNLYKKSTRLKKLSRDKHSSLFVRRKSDGEEQFFEIETSSRRRSRKPRGRPFECSALVSGSHHGRAIKSWKKTKMLERVGDALFTALHFLTRAHHAKVFDFTRPERLAKDRQSSLLGQFVSCKKKNVNTAPGPNV